MLHTHNADGLILKSLKLRFLFGMTEKYVNEAVGSKPKPYFFIFFQLFIVPDASVMYICVPGKKLLV